MATQDANDEEFRSALRDADDERLQSQATYWLKDKAKARVPVTPRTTARGEQKAALPVTPRTSDDTLAENPGAQPARGSALPVTPR